MQGYRLPVNLLLLTRRLVFLRSCDFCISDEDDVSSIGTYEGHSERSQLHYYRFAVGISWYYILVTAAIEFRKNAMVRYLHVVEMKILKLIRLQLI